MYTPHYAPCLAWDPANQERAGGPQVRLTRRGPQHGICGLWGETAVGLWTLEETVDTFQN